MALPLVCLCVSVSLLSSIQLAVSGRELVFTDDDLVLADGRKASVSLASDIDCQFQEDTTVLDDGTTSNIFKDFEARKSALLLSSEPDVCYIRDITQEELDSHIQKCKNGVELVKPEKPLPAPESYSDGEELSAESLTSELAEFCENRRIVSLVAAEVPTPTAGGKSKRCIKEITRVRRTELCCCQTVCTKWGWWTGKNKCKRKEEKCSTAERWEDVVTYIGCSR